MGPGLTSGLLYCTEHSDRLCKFTQVSFGRHSYGKSQLQAHFPPGLPFHCGFVLRISYFLANSMHLKRYCFYPALEPLSLGHLLWHSQTRRFGYFSRRPFHWDVSTAVGPLRAPSWCFRDLSSNSLPWMGPRLVFSLGCNNRSSRI